jgi:hypothetical protein
MKKEIFLFGRTIKYRELYKDSVIEVSIMDDAENESLKNIALRYLAPFKGKKPDGEITFTNIMGGETEWFILPFTFGTTIGKKLFEQFNAGLDGFDKDGILVLKKWLIEMEIIDDAMCY